MGAAIGYTLIQLSNPAFNISIVFIYETGRGCIRFFCKLLVFVFWRVRLLLSGALFSFILGGKGASIMFIASFYF